MGLKECVQGSKLGGYMSEGRRIIFEGLRFKARSRAEKVGGVGLKECVQGSKLGGCMSEGTEGDQKCSGKVAVAPTVSLWSVSVAPRDPWGTHGTWADPG